MSSFSDQIDLSPEALSQIKTVAIWGASRSGIECLSQLQVLGVGVLSFIDRDAAAVERVGTIPVVESGSVVDGCTFLDDVDAVILAMGVDPAAPRQMLIDIGFSKPIITFREGASIEKIFKGQFSVNHLFQYDHGDADRLLLQALFELSADLSKTVIYGAGKLTRYLLEVLDGVGDKVAAIIDDDAESKFPLMPNVQVIAPEKLATPPDIIFLSSTKYLTIEQMRKKARKLFGDAPSILLVEDVRDALSSADIPGSAWRTPENTIYPIEIPDIECEKNRDLILLDFPARFLGMMPNGLGYVHNILRQSGIKLQTLDLDMIFYHRYHASRVLDGVDRIIAPSGYEMKKDPWALTCVDGEWSNPEVIEFFRPEIERLIASLIEAKPTIIGISLHATNLIIAREVVARVRQALPDIIVLVGGYDCIRPEQGPHIFSDFDYMVIFEAESALPLLIKKLLCGEKPKNIPGVISKHDNPLFPFVAAPLVEDLDTIDFPRYEWTNIRNYRSYNGMQLTPIVLSRGCRWSRCTFCGERFHWRKRSASNLVDEIEWLVEQGCKMFHFNDSDLSGDPETVRDVCEEVIARGLTGLSFVGQLRVQKGYTPDYFRVLKEAGFSNLRYGIDGWSKQTLKLHRKGYTLAMIEDVIRMTKAAGISVAINLVIGIPNETEQDIDETIDNMVRNKAFFDTIENINTLMLFAGSLYWDNPDKYGIVFQGDREALYKKYPQCVPVEYWHSVTPYIDQEVRKKRLKRIIDAAVAEGIAIGSFAGQRVEKRLAD